MEETVDGEYQDYKAKDGAYMRKQFFGKYPELLGAGRGHVATSRSGRCIAAATIRRRSTPPMTPP